MTPTVKRGAREVNAEFQDLLRQASRNGWAPKCEGRPDLYADYLNVPDADEAEELCAGCPIYTLCREHALATKPAWGVWGGIAWVYGRQANSARPHRKAA